MKKNLLLYWYVSKTGWQPIYDLHLANLRYYRRRFIDDIKLVLSSDPDTPSDLIQKTKHKLRDVLGDFIELVYYPNDPEQREAKYFREELVLKLDQFERETAWFFVHNKGIASNYVTKNELKNWINFMYFANLYDSQKINEYLDKPETCCIGTFTWNKTKPWPFLKYDWHYSGTFFWLVPSRLDMYLRQHSETLPPPDRYFAEGFLGSVLPYNSGRDIHLYGSDNNFRCQVIRFIQERVPEADQKVYQAITASF